MAHSIAAASFLVHSSACRTEPGHRRVIDLEYAAENLPSALEWYDSANRDESRELAGQQ
jgi:hypothetical protein